jgi:hypothetical protein
MKEVVIVRMMEFVDQYGRNWKEHIDRITSHTLVSIYNAT